MVFEMFITLLHPNWEVLFRVWFDLKIYSVKIVADYKAFMRIIELQQVIN